MACLLLCTSLPIEDTDGPDDLHYLIWLLTVNSFAMSVSDTIIDGLMVIQARKDPKYGSDDLQTYSWIFLSIGGIICNVGAGLIPIAGENNNLGYKYSYLIPCTIGLGLTVTAFFINADIDGDARVIDMTLRKRIRFNLNLVKNGLQLKQLWQTLVFYVIVAFLTPSFRDYLDYYYNF